VPCAEGICEKKGDRRRRSIILESTDEYDPADLQTQSLHPTKADHPQKPMCGRRGLFYRVLNRQQNRPKPLSSQSPTLRHEYANRFCIIRNKGGETIAADVYLRMSRR
jgi:hypothetical protein